MALELSTAGVVIKYAVEAVAGTMPTTGYVTLPNIKSIPDLNPEPNSLEVTDLSETQYKRYISGLKDTGGALGLNANLTNAFKTAWNTLVTAYQTAKANGKSVWFEVVIPDLTDAFYFAGIPSELGLSAIDVDAVLEITAYIAPNKIHGWATKSLSDASVSAKAINVTEGSTGTVTITGFGSSVVCGSSNTSIATAVESSGTVTVTGVDAGVATIYIRGDAYAEVEVTVA